MNIIITTDGSDGIKDKIKEVIKLKIEKLNKFSNKIDRCKAFLKKGKNTGHEICIIELNLHLVGHDPFIAHGESDTFEKAIDLAVPILKTQLSKFHDKKVEHRIKNK